MSEAVQQLELIPGEPLEYTEQDVLLEQLPADALLEGDEVTEALVSSIRTFGLMDRIIVSSTPSELVLIAGRRRLKAYRLLLAEAKRKADAAGTERWERIPTRVIALDGPVPQALIIASHATRRPNPIAELSAIERLLDQGFDKREISARTGLPVVTIDKRMKLAALPPTLKGAAGSGLISASVAEQIASERPAVQERLVSVFQEQNKLTGGMVAKAREDERATGPQQALLLADQVGEIEPEAEQSLVMAICMLLDAKMSDAKKLTAIRTLVLELCNPAVTVVQGEQDLDTA